MATTGSDTAIGALACPSCHGALEPDAGALRCAACGRSYHARNAIWDFSPELVPQPGLAQRFMEAPAITRIYERWFRPALTRLVSPLGYADEELYLERWFAPVDGAILDLACGTGRYARWLGARTEDRRIVGLDLSLAMLREAKRCALAAHRSELLLARASALALPLGDETLGAAHSFGALHLFPDPAQALAEIGRTLRRGGSFTCLTTLAASDTPRSALQRTFTRAAQLRFFTAAELERDLAAARLERIDLTPRGMMVLFTARKR